MRCPRVVRWLETMALLIACTAPGTVGAQATREDSARSVVGDSVRKPDRLLTPGNIVLSPAPDSSLARTVDAEVRVATLELVRGDALPALSRLQRLSSLLARDSSAGPERAALRFMLAESYYRLGMLAEFHSEAVASLSAHPARYASVLRPQLVVEAYRAGDYARAISLARELPAADAAGVAGLVAGLAAYQTGDLAAARSRFQQLATVGGDVGPYARYMDALAQARADSVQPAAAIGALEAVAANSDRSFADQARLSAAQIAYESERYGDAERLASSVDANAPVAAPALLTRAWALYKLERVSDAEQAFSEFASRYPRLPEHDEAELMAAQAQLELGRVADAERIFQRVADSSAAEIAALQAQTNAALTDLARALVTQRNVELLTASDPVSAKALVMHASASAEPLVAAVTGTAGSQDVGERGHVSLASAETSRRLDSVAVRGNPTVSRVLFAPASATTHPRELRDRAGALIAADAAVTVARYRLAEQLAAQEREIALLSQLAASLAADSTAVAALVAEYQTVADSMARLEQLMASAEARLRDLLGREGEATRVLASENLRTVDSLRTSLAVAASPEDRATIEAEATTAAAYARIAEMTTRGLDNAIAHHPAFVMRDSVRAHLTHARDVVSGLQASFAGARRQLADALRAGDAPATHAARQALTDAEGRRTALEGEMIAAVTAELSARAGEMIAGLEHNSEAAQFGTASAAFFRAIEGTRAIGADADAAGVAPTSAAPLADGAVNEPRPAAPHRPPRAAPRRR